MPTLREILDMANYRKGGSLAGRYHMGWPYIGYEDYTPEGRAAMQAFNQKQGSHYLRPNTSPQKYTEAYESAINAANRILMEQALAQQRQNLSPEQMMNYESQSIPAPSVMPYVYDRGNDRK